MDYNYESGSPRRIAKRRRRRSAMQPKRPDDVSAPKEVRRPAKVSLNKLLQKHRPPRTYNVEDDVLEHSVEVLLNQMRDAEQSDAASFETTEPAIARLKLLVRIERELANVKLGKFFLQRKGLEILLGWLQKFPNGAWPSKALMLGILNIINHLDIDVKKVRFSPLESILFEIKTVCKHHFSLRLIDE